MKLTCPVCDRPDIDHDFCPNCETNLSTLRMLIDLPETRLDIPWWLLGVAVADGIVLGIAILAVKSGL